MNKNRWLAIALINLAVLAGVGVLLRCKILFPIPGMDFRNTLQAHSHFAFGGWITVCLFSLMAYEVLPAAYHNKPVYQWSLWGVLLTSVGMLITFPATGYAFLSILFSTLFIFATYVFSWAFIKDLIRSKANRSVTLLCIVSLLSLVLSSGGPFILAYILATHSLNTMLYRDAIYTYLHLQYNGFFTAGIFALFFNVMGSKVTEVGERNLWRFALALSACVLPTLFLSYLWHYDSAIIRAIALTGCACLAITLALYFIMMGAASGFTAALNPFSKAVGFLSMVAFVSKTGIQAGIVIPRVGQAVFGDRPIIIGYLHLVMLGFVSLYLLAHIYQSGYFNAKVGAAKRGIAVFAGGVVVNEIVLMTQGLSAMIMISSEVYPYLLLGAALWLLSGALMIAIPGLGNFRRAT